MVRLSDDEIYYTLILLVSFPLSHVVKLTNGAQKKRALCTATGVILVYITCGLHIVHSLITALVNIILIQVVGPRKCHIYAFVWCFGYLLFFRTCHYFGIPTPPALSNAVQLLLTLRLVGVAYEIHDTHCTKRDDCSTEDMMLKKKYQEINPSFVDLMTYSYCFLGQFTGPYYKYRTYIDMIENDNSSNIPTFDAVFNKMKPIVFLAPCLLGFMQFFSIEYVKTDEFYIHPFWFRLFYMVPMFIIFRCRMYSAWIIAESTAIASTLGAYPTQAKAKYGQGPTDLKGLEESKNLNSENLKYDFATVYNLSIYGCELAPRVRAGLRSWNMTVQYWLAHCVHRRVPQHLRAYSVVITMLVSSFWHGVHPGYYMSFLLVPVLVAAEDRMVTVFRDEKNAKVFDWLNWFFKMRGFDYMCMGFLLLKLNTTIYYWYSIFFFGHIMGLVFIIIGYSRPKPMRAGHQKTK